MEQIKKELVEKKIKLDYKGDSLGVLALVPWKSKKRIARIRRNLFRELNALNKELRRHKSEIKVS